MSKDEREAIRPCKMCGKTIQVNDEFILVGKYPESAIHWSGYPFRHFKAPETYGSLYHKSCFLESTGKEARKQNE